MHYLAMHHWQKFCLNWFSFGGVMLDNHQEWTQIASGVLMVCKKKSENDIFM